MPIGAARASALESCRRTLAAALTLMLLVRPHRPARAAGMLVFWLALVVQAAWTLVDDRIAGELDAVFRPDGVLGTAAVGLLAVGAGAWLSNTGARRPVLVWLAAALCVLVPTLVEPVLRLLEDTLRNGFIGTADHATLERALDLAWLAWTALALFQALRWFAPDLRRSRQAAVAVMAAAMMILPRYAVDFGRWYADPAPAGWTLPTEVPPVEEEVEPALVDAASVTAAQDGLMQAAVAGLLPQRVDQVDLYLVAFGGDASEDVFRNEVEYVDRLFRERYDGVGRTLVLLNHADTVDRHPIASLRNLERALAEIGRIADPAQDIVMLFVTTHGSEDHQLYIHLPPLDLEQIGPDALARALDGSGMRHRVAVVSACYSGGFLPALARPGTLVLTASRADRASFGCGSDSEITYFGRAFFANGLNQADALPEAFRLAKREIQRWEREGDEPHSYPQMKGSPEIEAQLKRWRAGLRLGLPVAFHPAGFDPDLSIDEGPSKP